MIVVKLCSLVVIFVLITGSPATSKILVESPEDELPLYLLLEQHQLTAAYQRIDDLIGNKFKPDSLGKAISAARSRLTSRFSMDNKLVKKGLKLFVSLEKGAESSETCDYESYIILARNYLAISKLPLIGPTRRRTIGQVVRNFMAKHAKLCVPTYEQRYEQLAYNLRLHRPSMRILKEIFGNIKTCDFVVGKPSYGAKRYHLISTEAEALQISESAIREIRDRIRLLVKNTTREAAFDEALRKADSAASFESRILNRYILKPCEEYISVLRDVFAPARLDAAALEGQEQEELLNSPNMEFRDGWERYRICLYLTKTDREKLVSTFMRAMIIRP